MALRYDGHYMHGLEGLERHMEFRLLDRKGCIVFVVQLINPASRQLAGILLQEFESKVGWSASQILT